jgi:TolB-like protein
VFGAGAELDALASGLVGSLSTILTRVPLLSIASRAASASFASQPVAAKEVGRRLGVAYLLEGSVQTIGDTVQANVQLIATRHGFHLWAQQFEVLNDPQAMAGLLHAILARLEPQLVRAIYNDQAGPDGSLTGRQLLIKAMSVLSLSGWHTASFTEVADLLNQAVARDGNLALAHAYLALILGLGQRIGIERASDDVVRQALDEAETAIRLDNMDSNVVGLSGCAIADVGQPDRAIPLLKNAIDLNPNNGHAWAALGSAYLIVGKVDEAVDHLQRGVDVSPLDSRLSIWFALLALACLTAGDLDRALTAAQAGCQSNDRIYLPRVAETAIYLAGGDQQAAARSLAECYRIKPDLTQNQIERLVGPKLGTAMAAMRAA